MQQERRSRPIEWLVGCQYGRGSHRSDGDVSRRTVLNRHMITNGICTELAMRSRGLVQTLLKVVWANNAQ
jgi:hypothetical protein